MSVRPVETARDPDLRGVPRALARAALRARELAERTGTCLVVVEDGQLKMLAVGRHADAAPAKSGDAE